MLHTRTSYALPALYEALVQCQSVCSASALRVRASTVSLYIATREPCACASSRGQYAEHVLEVKRCAFGGQGQPGMSSSDNARLLAQAVSMYRRVWRWATARNGSCHSWVPSQRSQRCALCLHLLGTPSSSKGKLVHCSEAVCLCLAKSGLQPASASPISAQAATTP